MESTTPTMLHGIKITLIEPNILRYDVPKDMQITLEIITALREFGNTALPNQKRKVLGVFNSNFIPTHEAGDFMASELRAQTVAAEAFVINSVALKLMTNFYLTIKKPKIKSKAFDDEALALAWLRNQWRISRWFQTVVKLSVRKLPSSKKKTFLGEEYNICIAALLKQ